MIDTEAVRRALGDLERHAPAESDVLVGFRRGIVRRRRRRQAASVAGVAGVAALVALGVVVLAPARGADPTEPAPGTAPAASSSGTIATPPGPPALPFTVGSLPAGYTLGIWHVSTTGSHANWVGAGDHDNVDVHLKAKPEQTGRYLSDEPTTVAGRPGRLREQAAQGRGNMELTWQLADGRWFMVMGKVPAVPLRAIAESLTTEPTPLSGWSGLDLSTLPDGYQVNTWSGRGPMVNWMALSRRPFDLYAEESPADRIDLSLAEGTAPASLDGRTKEGATTKIPMDREEIVNGVPTRASADGTMALGQVDAGHWALAFSKGAGADLLREVVSTVVVR